ncbi:hypothetical protein WJX74_007483 [Apatococcus lobatus]|uniref:Uncharacterized protein n=1 Tax=Apatococcus lobatus TaxID=904363 RepID=A0AAW1RST5_9CHLO
MRSSLSMRQTAGRELLHKYPSACSLTWAPTKDSLAILHDSIVQVVEPSAAGASLRQLCGHADATAELKCEWDPWGRYLDVMSTRDAYDMGEADASRDERKSHPFLCAWLPGTTIYAAAALGHVYVVDGRHDALLKMWRADAQEDPSFAGHRCPPYQPENAGLSWSSDGRCLAWLDELSLHIIGFD